MTVGVVVVDPMVMATDLKLLLLVPLLQLQVAAEACSCNQHPNHRRLTSLPPGWSHTST